MARCGSGNTSAMATVEELLGALVVVGISYSDADQGERLHQVAGTIERVGEDVIELRQADGSTFTLPPAPEAFEPAEPGIYTLRSTGEQIAHPSFMATFRVE
jgi:hypothetical protein